MPKARSNQNKKTIRKNTHYLSIFDDDGVVNYYGIPAILLNKTKILIYSPFSQKFALLPSILLDKQETVQNLRKKGFFASISFESDKLKKKKEINLALSVTTGCNQQCKYCFADTEFLGSKTLNLKGIIMEPEAAIFIVKRLNLFFKIRSIDFLGGEPTTNIDAIKSAVSAVKAVNQNPVFIIQTNGIMPNYVLEYLIKENFFLSVSWDGLKSNNLFRGCEGPKVEKNILKLVKSKARFKVHMTIGKWNIGKVLSSIKWLFSNGVKFIHLEPLKPLGMGKALANQVVSPEEFIRTYFRAVALAEEKNKYILNYAFVNLFSPNDYFCPTAAGNGFVFNPGGLISGCYRVQKENYAFAKSFSVGKWKKRNEQINFNPAVFKRLDFKGSKFIPCKKCPFLYICSGGCPLNHLEFNPENTSFIRHIDPSVCDLRKGLITKAILLMYNYALRKKPHFLNGWEMFWQR